jgi:5-methylcytosine-specific restriction enzyme A
MPWAMKRPCSYPGCHKIPLHGSRCDVHPYPDQHDPASQRLYNSRRWKRIRVLQLAKDPWCADCLKAGIYTIATEVDHLVAHKGDPALFYHGELQSLCKICHSRKTLQEIRDGGAKSLELGDAKRQGPASRKKFPDRNRKLRGFHA